MSINERFWSKVNKDGPIPPRFPELGKCWEWTASLGSTGYGQISIQNKPHKAHRVAWELTNGEPPGDLSVLHKCDNPLCVNPKHLFLGTQKDNMKDMDAKNRRVNPPLCKGEKQGLHKLTAAQVNEIRERHSKGDITQRELAAEMNVHFATISKIITGKTWL